MIIDFHTHSNASDGSLEPAELVRRAIDAGVARFAITDHDTVAGYLRALEGEVDFPAGFLLVPGVELSCQWAGASIHVVGLGVDVSDPGLLRGLQTLAQARLDRAAAIAERLAKLGFSGALEGAREIAGESQLGRPHFASWMVDQGHVKDPHEAFDRYLGAGKVGDVKAFWPELAEVTGWLAGAGGVAVLAHPGKYRMTRSKLRRLLDAFRTAGGRGLEVVCGRQPREQSLEMCKLAAEYELLISAGSDFHRYWDYGPQLGVNVSRLPRQPSIWQQVAA
jgi:predicted metal-dependent phosphoesterase TrpH